MENTSRQASIFYDNLRGLTSFLPSKTHRVQFCVLQIFYETPFRRLKPKLYSITISRKVLYGEIIWGFDNVYYGIDQVFRVCLWERFLFELISAYELP